MVGCRARVVGWAAVGGGPWRHAEYRLEVAFEGRQWVIYRRYAAFAELDRQMRDALGAEKAANADVWQAALPQKMIGGTLGSSITAVAEGRMTSLQSYLDAVLAYDTDGGERIAIELAFTSFFDLAHKGVSGAQLELGAANIVRESFARTRDARHALTMWHNYFLVVTTRGVLYVLRGLYEKPTAAVLSLPLVDSQLKVATKKGDNLQVDLVGTDRSLFLRFTSTDEAAAWVRILADFVTPQPSGKQTLEQKRKFQQQMRLAQQEDTERRLAELPVENIRTAGTGNTKDELSNVYGM